MALSGGMSWRSNTYKDTQEILTLYVLYTPILISYNIYKRSILLKMLLQTGK